MDGKYYCLPFFSFSSTTLTFSPRLRPFVFMQEGLDHIGFKVEDLTKAKDDLADLSVSSPQSAPKQVAGRRFGDITRKDLEACVAGKYGTADPDGVLLHFSE